MAGFILCVLMIFVYRKFSKSHMAGFLGGLLCASAYRCIFICSVVWRSRVTWSGIFWWFFTSQVMHWYRLIVSVQIKGIRKEICGWFVIIWVFTSIKINIIELRGIFRSGLCGRALDLFVFLISQICIPHNDSLQEDTLQIQNMQRLTIYCPFYLSYLTLPIEIWPQQHSLWYKTLDYNIYSYSGLPTWDYFKII